MAHNVRVRFNTRYLWIGSGVSCEHPDWIGLDRVNETGPLSNSTVRSKHDEAGDLRLCELEKQ